MHSFLTFLILTIVVITSPGIDTALITKTTISRGKKAGLQMAFGISTGSLVHTCAAALGLSAILLKSALAFEVIKYIGAVYLLYLGVQAFWSTRKGDADTAELRIKVRGKSPYNQGLLSNALNPKVAVFFLTFLPQFVEPGANTMEQLFLMGVIYTGLAIVWFLIYVSFVNYLRHRLQSPNVKRMMERITGVVLIGFGLKLAFEKRQ